MQNRISRFEAEVSDVDTPRGKHFSSVLPWLELFYFLQGSVPGDRNFTEREVRTFEAAGFFKVM